MTQAIQALPKRTGDRRNGIPLVCPLFEYSEWLGEWCTLHNWTCSECLDSKSPYYEHPCHVRKYLFKERFLLKKKREC